MSVSYHSYLLNASFFQKQLLTHLSCNNTRYHPFCYYVQIGTTIFLVTVNAVQPSWTEQDLHCIRGYQPTTFLVRNQNISIDVMKWYKIVRPLKWIPETLSQSIYRDLKKTWYSRVDNSTRCLVSRKAAWNTNNKANFICISMRTTLRTLCERRRTNHAWNIDE